MLSVGWTSHWKLHLLLFELKRQAIKYGLQRGFQSLLVLTHYRSARILYLLMGWLVNDISSGLRLQLNQRSQVIDRGKSKLTKGFIVLRAWASISTRPKRSPRLQSCCLRGCKPAPPRTWKQNSSVSAELLYEEKQCRTRNWEINPRNMFPWI